MLVLQVERGLQSKLVQLEAEGHRLADQLAAAEATLREERASHTRDRENLMLVSTNILYTVIVLLPR